MHNINPSDKLMQNIGLIIPVSALILLIGHHEGHLIYKNMLRSTT